MTRGDFTKAGPANVSDESVAVTAELMRAERAIPRRPPRSVVNPWALRRYCTVGDEQFRIPTTGGLTYGVAAELYDVQPVTFEGRAEFQS